MSKKRIIIEVEDSLHKAIKKRCDEQGITITRYLKEMIIGSISGDSQSTRERVFMLIKNNKEFWKALRASVNYAFALNENKSVKEVCAVSKVKKNKKDDDSVMYDEEFFKKEFKINVHGYGIDTDEMFYKCVDYCTRHNISLKGKCDWVVLMDTAVNAYEGKIDLEK